MSEKLVQAIDGGLSVHQAAAICGICRTTAYSRAEALGLIEPRRIEPDTRGRILAMVERGGRSAQDIATACGVSKSSVLRIRDRAAGAMRGPSRTRSTYACPGCGQKVRLRPCVICIARSARCQHAES